MQVLDSWWPLEEHCCRGSNLLKFLKCPRLYFMPRLRLWKFSIPWAWLQNVFLHIMHICWCWWNWVVRIWNILIRMKPKGLLLVIILISLDFHAWEGRFRYQGSQFVQVNESIESTPLASSITFNQLGEWPFPVKSKNWVYLREESSALFMNNYSYPMHCNNHLAFYVVLVLHTCVGLYLFFNFAVQEMQLFSPWDYSL